ncbi:Variant-specific surface protein [Giardia duodenalis]|uniref:Variant-specific surface protein n=1 Tax=Giardia intestinalis TaxID=5741 RepID=V6TF45_GIAIN|nr:Variant-specific surface protein [Giardia intestinalis]
MLKLLLLFFVGSFCGLPTGTYCNGFGIECGQGHEHCFSGRCLLIGSTKVCTRCVSGYVPINGVCQPYPGSASSVCIPEEAESSIRCIKCKPNENVFLFYGGCYTVDRSAVGGQICSRASNGRCVECNVSTHGAYVFTNPNETAEERCIACSDSIGFSGYGGVLECYSCTQPVTGGKTTALCTKCRSPEQNPIDHECRAKGLHTCFSGLCVSCYKTHLLYHSGCYSRGSNTGLAICAAKNQYVLDNVTICKECVNTLYAPKSGVCVPVDGDIPVMGFSDCTKDNDKGLCINCANSAEYFLFYGGCYYKKSGIGSRLCSAVVSGVCTEWKTQFDFIFNKNDNDGGYLCGDATNGGVSDCATCSYESGAVTCTRCSAGYLGVDGKSCSESCSEDTRGACTKVTEGSESTEVSCRCVCRMGLYSSFGTCVSCTDSCAICKDSTPDGCQICKPGKILEPSVVANGNAKCVDECAVGSECAECGITIDGSRYCTRCKDSNMYPLNGVCFAGAQKDPYCTSKANGVCITCSSSAFLMNGGCYTTEHYPGSTICDKQVDGKCTTTKKGYWISDDGKLLECDPTCLACTAPGPGRCTRCPSDKLLKKVSGATTGSCVDPGACADGYYADGDACLPCATPGCKTCGRTSFCTECAGELFVSLDGRSCLGECTGDRVVGEAPGGVQRCWCERGFLPAPDKSGCVPAPECPPDMPWCAACNESGNCLSCVTSGHNVQVDQRTCAEGCGARASSNQGVCMCETGTILDKGVCIPVNTLTGRKMVAVTVSAASAVLVISALIGFLCWWFICRGKRRYYR